jgi:hypothetical protein
MTYLIIDEDRVGFIDAEMLKEYIKKSEEGLICDWMND